MKNRMRNARTWKPKETLFMLQNMRTIKTTATTTKKKRSLTMRIRQNPNSNYFNRMFAHYAVLDASSMCMLPVALTNRSRYGQACERRTGMFAYMWIFQKWFCFLPSFISDDFILVIVQNIANYMYTDKLSGFVSYIHNEMVHLKCTQFIRVYNRHIHTFRIRMLCIRAKEKKKKNYSFARRSLYFAIFFGWNDQIFER